MLPINIVLLGLPIARKGPQARYLCSTYNLTHLPVGALLRCSAGGCGKRGQSSATRVRQSRSSKDAAFAEGLIDRLGDLGSKGLLLDGYPKTYEQAVALDDLVSLLGRQIDMVLHFNVGQAALKQRVGNPASRCDAEGLAIRQHEDRIDFLITRLQDYENGASPVLDHYREQGKLREVDANLDAGAVSAEIAILVDGFMESQEQLQSTSSWGTSFVEGLFAPCLLPKSFTTADR
jgi:adenylate kinase